MYVKKENKKAPERPINFLMGHGLLLSDLSPMPEVLSVLDMSSLSVSCAVIRPS